MTLEHTTEERENSPQFAGVEPGANRKSQRPVGCDFGLRFTICQNRKGEGKVWLWAERLLLVLGVTLLAVFALARPESIVASRAAMEKFAAIESSVATPGGEGEGDDQATPLASSLQDLDSSAVDFNLWDAGRVRNYKKTLARHVGAPLAVLRIPRIQLEVPLFDGTSDLTLNHAVGRIAGTARPGEPGNIGIAGHRDGFFRGLKDVRTGDAIELKTPAGTDTYVVERIQIVTPDDVSVLQPRSVSSLTLVTCYPFHFIGGAPQRYIVTASLNRGIQSASENSTSDSPSKHAVQKGE